jgi:hypothetical protein
MSRYLEEAAELLRKSAQTNEEDNEDYPSLLVEGRERIAREFAVLAAIDKGLLPIEITEDVIESIINDRA